MLVGGKGLYLAELSRIEGLRVPAGFSVTTKAYKKVLGDNQELNALLDELSLLKADDRDKIHKTGKKGTAERGRPAGETGCA